MGKVKNKYGQIGWAIFFMAICGLVAGLDKLATKHTLDPWYVRLKDFSWVPPEWVFGPIWTWLILYFLLAIAGTLISISSESQEKRQTFLFYFSQLAVNALWFTLFFYLRMPITALFAVIGLLLLLGTMLRICWNVSRTAVCLSVPYLIWIFYVGLLNAITVHFH